MNTNRRNLLNFGNINVGKMISAARLACEVSPQELEQMLHSFNYREILIQLARINLFFQRSSNFFSAEKTLKSNFCSIPMLHKIAGSEDLSRGVVFARQSTLRLLDICARVSDLHSTRTIDENDAKADFVKAYLNINGLLDAESSILSMGRDEDKKKLLVESIPNMEYAIIGSPEYTIKKLLVRIEDFLRRVRKESLTLDMNKIFAQATDGLELRDYQRLILGIFAFYWNFTPEEICRQGQMDKPLFFNPNGHSPDLTLLFKKLLPYICISIDDLKDKARSPSGFKNAFHLWRKYPLLRISENQIICIDFGFLLEKLQTGVFWIIRSHLRQSSDAGTFERLWGDVFTDYAASIVEHGINAPNSYTRDKLIVKPEYDQKQQTECSDIAICNDDSLVLLECKATILSAPAKFSGDFGTFYDNIKPGKKGIKQLWNAICLLGNRSETIKRSVRGIDMTRVKKIYPVLVLSDGIFSTLFMNWFWDTEFKSLKQQSILMEYIEVMPLTILTIADLESLEPYLNDKPFCAHLDEWLDQFKDNDVQSFSGYLYGLMDRDPRVTQFMDQEFERIWSDGQGYFSSREEDPPNL